MTDVTDKTTMNDIFYNTFCEKIDDDSRGNFLVSRFKKAATGVWFESMFFHIAGKMSDDYRGGYWDFATTKDGDAFFMHLDKEKTFNVSGFASTHAVDGRIFGVVVALTLFSQASFALYDAGKEETASEMGEYYHSLRNAFYGTVDELAYFEDGERHPDISDREIEEIKKLGNTVYRILD